MINLLSEYSSLEKCCKIEQNSAENAANMFAAQQLQSA